MDHKELLDRVEKRLDTTDVKIDKVHDLVAKNEPRLAVAENQISGIIKAGFLLTSTILGLIGYALKKGLF